MTRYIVVTGGVLSGLGKGIVSSSIGNLLAGQGYVVAPIKIDPYINIDAGTMRPTEHGEVFVTDDGGETDQDLGNYERFIGITVGKDHNITTGQVYRAVIQKERNLEYDGRCVEVIPHIPLEVERRIEQVAKKTSADFVIIEIGGTIGDYQSVLFLEAMRQMKRKLNHMVFVHVVYLPIPGNLGEMKTKPAQHSVRELMQSGIQPDFLVARAEKAVDSVRKEKLALFCNVRREDVFAAPDVTSIYEIPLLLEEQDFTQRLLERFGIEPKSRGATQQWKRLVERFRHPEGEVNIAVVGKYFDIGDFSLEDSYISVIEAVKHAAYAHNVRPVIHWIDSKAFEKDEKRLAELSKHCGIIIPGGFGGSGVEGKIRAIKYAREKNLPFLGLCYGLQLAVVEYARHVAGLSGANTTEIDQKTKHPVIDILPEQRENLRKRSYGATMRLGSWPAVLAPGSVVQKLYRCSEVSERHRHRYEVNPDYIERLENAGLVFSGRSPDSRLMEFLELPKHRYFIATQAHPEFKSRPLEPHPLFLGFVEACLDSSRINNG